MKLPDGTHIQSSLAGGDTKQHPESNFPYLLLGTVIKVHFKDESDSLSKKVVEYDVQTWDPQFVFRRVPMMTPRNGVNDGYVPILRAGAVVENQNPMDDTDGDIVVMGFVGGELGQPFILGCYPNTKSGSPVGLAADGETHTIKHKGATIRINDDGSIDLEPASGKLVQIGITGFEPVVLHTALRSYLNGHIHGGVSTGGSSTTGPVTPLGASEAAASDVEAS